MIKSGWVAGALKQCIDEVEYAGYDLEMSIQEFDDRTASSQKRLKRLVKLADELRKVQKLAAEIAI